MVEEKDEAPIRKNVELQLSIDTATHNSEENPFKWVLHLAEAFDAWRPFPRIFLTVYLILLYRVVDWFMAIPDPSAPQSGLVSVVVGAGAAWFGLYAGTGKDKEVKK